MGGAIHSDYLCKRLRAVNWKVMSYIYIFGCTARRDFKRRLFENSNHETDVQQGFVDATKQLERIM